MVVFLPKTGNFNKEKNQNVGWNIAIFKTARPTLKN